MVINSLVVSLFVYKMYVLPNIPTNMVTRIYKILEEFIWNGRKAKISLKKLQDPKYLGGAGLVDMVQKEKAMKISWVPYIVKVAQPYLSELVYQELAPQLRDKIWCCNIKPDDICKVLPKKSFWTQTWQAWAQINYSKSNSLDNIIWFNSNIKIEGKPFIWKKPLKNNLMYIYQFFNGTSFVSPNEAMDKYQLNIMQYNTLVTIIRKMSFQSEDPKHENKLKIVTNLEKPVKWAYSQLTANKSLQMDLYVRWQIRLKTDMLYDEFLQDLRNIKVTTNVSKLRSFQFRLTNLALVMNNQLCNWKIRNNGNCRNCGLKEETIEHFFYECTMAKMLIAAIPQIVEKYDKTVNNIAPNVVQIIFNRLTLTQHTWQT